MEKPPKGVAFLCPYCNAEKAYYNYSKIIRCDKCECQIYTKPPVPPHRREAPFGCVVELVIPSKKMEVSFNPLNMPTVETVEKRDFIEDPGSLR